ncbi:MAG: D-amino-acid transaminase [Pseudomonadota bacterium]
MSRIAYVNGLYQPYDEASIHVEDRGFQFADGVYEVCEVRDRHLIDETRHMQRLKRSLAELEIEEPMSLQALGCIMRETIRRNRVRDGSVYLQITRGCSRRDFIYPEPAVLPTVVCLARKISRKSNDNRAEQGIAVTTLPDIRWKRPDIKSVSLLPNAMAKQAAKKAGAFEAWLLDEHGYVTEGASSSAWILTHNDILKTRQVDSSILNGITRGVLIDLLKAEGIAFEEQKFSLEEAKQAKEAFLTSASNGVMPIVRIDDTIISGGKPGHLSVRLRKQFYSKAEFCN